MLLTINVGNTSTAISLHDGEGFLRHWRCRTEVNRTADEYFVWLERLLQLDGVEASDITGAILASVVPPATEHLKGFSRLHLGVPMMVIGEEGCHPGIELRVDNPGFVGADRIANAVGGAVLHGGNLIIVDVGTATTFDVVDTDGAYIGGLIAPGINPSLDALHRAAACLPRIDVRRSVTVIGKDTVPAMRSGIYWGYLSLIDGICARIGNELRQERTKESGKPKVIATGGLAGMFAADSESIDEVDRALTMRGLVEIHRRSKA